MVEPETFPDTVEFLSSGEKIQLQEGDNDEYVFKTVNKKRSRVRVKSDSATYIYISDGRKNGSELPVALSYLQKLHSFGLIKFQYKQDEPEEELKPKKSNSKKR